MTSTPQYVRDLMTVGVQTCKPEMPISNVAKLLLDKDIEGLIVLDHEGHGVGIVTWDELVAGYGHPRVAHLTAEDIMREDVPELPPDIPITAAAQLMKDMGLRIVFVMHNAGGIIYPAAVLTYKHIIRHLAAETDEDLKDLGIEAEREAPLETFIKKRDKKD